MDLYDSSAWKELNLLSRAQLLLVIEGVKRGTIIQGNRNGFLGILKDAGLEYKINSDPHHLKPAFTVAKKEILEEVAHRKICLPKDVPSGEYHRINGWMLSYPPCCVEAYISGQSRFDRELSDIIKQTGKYPDVFDYRVPPFTPCNTNCEKAINTLSSWKKAIDKTDKEAAQELVYFNRKQPPTNAAHRKYLQEQREIREKNTCTNF